MGCAGALGCSRPKPAALSVGQMGSPEDRVGIDDTFDVRVYGEAELSGTFRIATDGTVEKKDAAK